MKLLLNAIIKFTLGAAIVFTLLFLPSGTLSYMNGWLFMGLLFIPMLALGTVLFIKDPKLLEKRLDSKEKESAQRKVVGVFALLFVCTFISAGLDFRYALSHVPAPVVGIASTVLLFSYLLYAEVMRENSFLSRTVEVCENQTVVDSGLYGIVRHPMYTSTLLLFLSIPIVLGSWLSLCFSIPFIPLIIARILNEEKLLSEKLSGYTEYKNKVKYRLIPFVW